MRAEASLHPRQDRTDGFAPEARAAPWTVSLCGGGLSLPDAERLPSGKKATSVPGASGASPTRPGRTSGGVASAPKVWHPPQGGEPP